MEAAPPTRRLDLPLDAHLHTDFSHDSQVPIRVYAALARDTGVARLAITDHLDFTPGYPNFALGDHARRMRVVREAAEQWGGDPEIRFGVEITYERRREAEIREYLSGHAYDFTIGSIHSLPGLPSPYEGDGLARWSTGKTHREASAPYWDELEAAIRSGLFDAIGHLDVVKRWLFRHLGPFEYQANADIYERILVELVEAGCALEVNSSGLRHSPREAYPSPAVVDRFRALGGAKVTAGTDAHTADDFGFALRDAYAAITGAGLDAVTFRDTRLPFDAGAVLKRSNTTLPVRDRPRP